MEQSLPSSNPVTCTHAFITLPTGRTDLFLVECAKCGCKKYEVMVEVGLYNTKIN